VSAGERRHDAGTATDDAARSLRFLKAHVVGFRPPTPSAIEPVHTADITTGLNDLVIRTTTRCSFDIAAVLGVSGAS
jgi:hypothetical protein